MKQRLVILIWNMGIGGVQKRVRDVVMEISKKYPLWEVYLLVEFKKPDNFVAPLIDLPGVEIEYYPGFLWSKRGIFRPIWVWLRLLSIKPDVVLSFMDYLSVMVQLVKLGLFKKPRTVINEGIVTSKYQRLNNRSWYWRRLVIWFYPKANRIIVPTRSAKKDLIRHYTIPQQRIQVVPNWTLFESRKPMAPRYDLIYVGRFEEEKNALGYVEIVKKVHQETPMLQAVMVGEGKQRSLLEKKIEDYGLNQALMLPGFSYQIQSLLLQSRILVLPTKNEGMPNVVLEAAMCGVPTVSSRFAGAYEVILDGETGYVCSNETEMAKRIIELMKDEQKRHEMGQAAKIHVTKHFHQETQTQYIQLLLGEGL
jgi:glycosyltransferase involved in cell wall biosynthesis